MISSYNPFILSYIFLSLSLNNKGYLFASFQRILDITIIYKYT